MCESYGGQKKTQSLSIIKMNNIPATHSLFQHTSYNFALICSILRCPSVCDTSSLCNTSMNKTVVAIKMKSMIPFKTLCFAHLSYFILHCTERRENRKPGRCFVLIFVCEVLWSLNKITHITKWIKEQRAKLFFMTVKNENVDLSRKWHSYTVYRT